MEVLKLSGTQISYAYNLSISKISITHRLIERSAMQGVRDGEGWGYVTLLHYNWRKCYWCMHPNAKNLWMCQI